MLYGLLIRSASDPYSGPTLGKGGGGSFKFDHFWIHFWKEESKVNIFPIQGKRKEDV